MENLATFVINLDRDAERLAETTACLDKAGLPFTRVQAILGAEISDTDPGEAMTYAGRSLLPGEIGCFQSHRLAAQAFLDTSAPMGLVLEDDITMRADAMDTLAALVEARNRFSIWDVMSLARPAKHWRTPVRRAVWDGPGRLFHAHYFPVTTTALLWSRGGAREFLMETSVMRQPVDVQLQVWATKTGRGLAFDVPPLAAREAQSTIGQTHRTRAQRSPQYRKIRLARLIQTHKAAMAHKFGSGYVQ